MSQTQAWLICKLCIKLTNHVTVYPNCIMPGREGSKVNRRFEGLEYLHANLIGVNDGIDVHNNFVLSIWWVDLRA